MGLFNHKKKYERLGKLSRKEWEEKLLSDRGLFKRAKKLPKGVIGPTLSDDKVIGDTLSVETTIFVNLATSEQNSFYDKLIDDNIKAAKEYELVISGAIHIWAEDIKLLEKLSDALDNADEILKKEEKFMEKEVNLIEKVPVVLKKHFPDLFKNIIFENMSFEKILETIKEKEKEVESEENYIKDYIKEKKEEIPILKKFL